MNSKNDREYLITVKTEYKLLEKKYLKDRKDLTKWENRVNLARQKGETGLQMEAEGQAEIIRNDIKYLTNQLFGLKRELENAKRSFDTAKHKPELSTDPKRLLADMENLIGNGNIMELEKDINEIKVDNELKRLKKRMDL